MKLSYKSKNNKKAFTLIELLIVIAIIGILFIVLVSRVDFATDKAKATGVQTDFRSFQLALDQVAKENTGFNTFGWDTGDTNGDRTRNSYDLGDSNLNGKEDTGETFVGRKFYGETWTSVYTMINPDTTKAGDISAFVALEQAINANLDPKLHITITPDVDGGTLTGNATITMANQARDPWKNEYHGVFITNATRDNGDDRGAIIIYSNGANGVWGSAHDITNGVVEISVPGNNVAGQDDYSMVSCYTYTNGFGEVKNLTTGFSTNQNFLSQGERREPSYLDDNNKFIYSGIKYMLWNGDGSFGMFDENNNFVMKTYDGSLIATIPEMCIIINNDTVVIHDTGTEFDGTFVFRNNGTEIYMIDNGEIQIVALQDGYCKHKNIGDDTQWYEWYDGYVNMEFWKDPPSFEELKRCTLRCNTCFVEIPTKIFDDSGYVYLYNAYMEPQFDETGNEIGGRCVDISFTNVNGWMAIPYSLDNVNNLYTSIDGKPVQAAWIADGTVVSSEIKNMWGYYYREGFEFTYLGSVAQFKTVRHPYAGISFADDLARNAKWYGTITVHCSDGDIVFEK